MNVVKKIFVGIFLIAFFIFAIGMSILLLNMNEYKVTVLGDTSLVVIPNEISSEKYEKGDLVLVESKPINRIEKGDEIFAYRISDSGETSIDLGFVEEIYADDNSITYENGSTFSMKYVIGEADTVYEGIGTYVSMLQSTWVFFFVIVVPCFLIFIYQIYALVIEIKYGDDK